MTTGTHGETCRCAGCMEPDRAQPCHPCVNDLHVACRGGDCSCHTCQPARPAEQEQACPQCGYHWNGEVCTHCAHVKEPTPPSRALLPPPTGNGTPIWPLVIADMQARDAMGTEKYGTSLRAHNGRDALVDAYQEALDLAVYLRQAIEERNG